MAIEHRMRRKAAQEQVVDTEPFKLFFFFFASQTLRNIKQNIIYKKKIPAL
jgi:hypothetical protein